MDNPKILILDIETSPIMAHVWGLFDQNIGLNQIVKEWGILSWSAKWYGDPASKIMYMDQRDERDIENQKKLLKGIWKLLDEADIVIGQYIKKFDIKKLNAKFILNGMKPPSSYKQIDTVVIARKYFEFTSNKLEYLTDKLCTKYKKLKHKKFPGHTLWTECLKGNKEAWNEMEEYNKHDVLSTEELYDVLKAWDNSINFNIYSDSLEHICKCGSKQLHKNGFAYTSVGKYQRYVCKKCGSESRDRTNLLSKEKRQSLKK